MPDISPIAVLLGSDIAAAFVLASGIAAAFWKADEALSPDALDRIRATIRRRQRLPRDVDFSKISRDQFNRIFGDNFISRKSISRSFIISSLYYWALIVIFSLLFSDNLKVVFAISFFLFVIYGLFNNIFDFISLSETRYLLGKRLDTTLKKVMFLIFDFIATTFIISLAGLIYAMIIFIDQDFFDNLFGAFADFMTKNFMSDASGDDKSTAFFISIGAMIVTSYLTSVWIWIFIFGKYFYNLLRTLSTPAKFMLWALNFDERPIRSIAITFSVFIFTLSALGFISINQTV